MLIGILGIKTVFPLPQPVNIMHSSNELLNFLICSLVPLQSVGGLKFLIKIIGAPIFKISECAGTLEGVKKLRNLVGK
jgi:hypothetical protein